MSKNIAEQLNFGLCKMGETLSQAKVGNLIALIEELERWNKKINLTAIRPVKNMISGHLLDSLAVRPFLHGKTIIDVGSGAGFPGLPLAIADPKINFMLLDSNRKKIGFIKHIISLLNLKNVEVIKIRAEDYFPANGFDTVIARALTDIPNLIALTGHMLRKRGVIVSLKGKNPTEELSKIPEGWKYSVTKITVPGLEQHERHIISLQNLIMQSND